MKLFSIFDLIPLEDVPRDYSLRFITQVWRNFKSFSLLDTVRNVPPYVYTFGGCHYLDDGNHRSMWNLFNGIDTIHAEEEFPDSKRQRCTLMTVESAQERGVYCVADLVKKVNNPEQYSLEGPITHVITPEDLTNPKYYLRI